MTVVYCPGVFDLFHIGHLNVLRESKKLGDVLVVGVVSDEGTKAYKGEYPVIAEAQRLEIIRSIDCVDFAIIQQETDPTRELEVIRPDILTHGDDWSKLLRGQETLQRLGIKFVLLPYTENVSSSMIKQIIKRQ